MRALEDIDYEADRDADLGMPILLTKQQAAAWAQVSLSKLQEWLDEPGFPAIRTPRHVRIHARKFEEWLAHKAGGEA